ncbi:hypothetical protein [Haladaptatus cibarius]|uniref:hypothetical protein n=1 Tax=Haladaptatus cibarius TaxID=453847 RepID=UPI0006790B8C|nr:hypothetical protein [Haladaptatus cibarius]
MDSNSSAGGIDWRLLGTAVGTAGITALLTVAVVVFGISAGFGGPAALLGTGLGAVMLLGYFAATTATPANTAHAAVEIGYTAKDAHLNADNAFHVVDAVLFVGVGLVAGGLLGLVVVW